MQSGELIINIETAGAGVVLTDGLAVKLDFFIGAFFIKDFMCTFEDCVNLICGYRE